MVNHSQSIISNLWQINYEIICGSKTTPSEICTIESCWSRVPTDKLIMAVAIPK